MDDHFPLLALRDDHLVISRIVERMIQRAYALARDTEDPLTGEACPPSWELVLNLHALLMMLGGLLPEEIQASIAAEQTRFEEETARWS